MDDQIENVTVQSSTDQEASALDLQTCDSQYALSWILPKSIETVTVQSSTDQEAGALDLQTCDSQYALSWILPKEGK
jgi:hypothetical protein